MMESIGMIMAMGGAGAEGGQGGGGMVMVGYMAIFLLLLYFMMIRPQARREKERKAMLGRVKSGDRVLFGGGLVGTVANVKNSVLVIKIAENVKVEAVRGAVTRVLDKDETLGEESVS